MSSKSFIRLTLSDKGPNPPHTSGEIFINPYWIRSVSDDSGITRVELMGHNTFHAGAALLYVEEAPDTIAWSISEVWSIQEDQG